MDMNESPDTVGFSKELRPRVLSASLESFSALSTKRPSTAGRPTIQFRSPGMLWSDSMIAAICVVYFFFAVNRNWKSRRAPATTPR